MLFFIEQTGVGIWCKHFNYTIPLTSIAKQYERLRRDRFPLLTQTRPPKKGIGSGLRPSVVWQVRGRRNAQYRDRTWVWCN